MNAIVKLDQRLSRARTFLSVGLDPDLKLMPQKYASGAEPLFSFCRMVIDSTQGFAAAFKPNSAFFEAHGAAGINQLKKTCDYLRQTYPEIPIILDAKLADISSTNQGYASFAFDYLGVDGITLHPYLGSEAMQPFLSRRDKLCLILCRTSNPGAGQFQDLPVTLKNRKMPLYEAVAHEVVRTWNKNGNCLVVVGATYPKELARVRTIVGDMTILVPGVGSQGGEVVAVVAAGLNRKGRGLLINVSRAILYAGDEKAIARQAKQFRDSIKTSLP